MASYQQKNGKNTANTHDVNRNIN